MKTQHMQGRRQESALQMSKKEMLITSFSFGSDPSSVSFGSDTTPEGRFSATCGGTESLPSFCSESEPSDLPSAYFDEPDRGLWGNLVPRSLWGNLG